MKNILKTLFILIFSIIILTSCNNTQNNNNNENQNNVEQNNNNQNNIDKNNSDQNTNLENLSARDIVNKTLFDIGIELYNNKKYETYKTSNETYFLNINNLKELGYNTEKLKKCEKETTGITIDPLNKENLNYKEYPMLIHVFCDFE